MTRRHVVVLAFLPALLLSTAICSAQTYTGSLSWDKGIDATGAWQSPVTTFDWTVEMKTGYWNYDYTLALPEGGGATSHFILETSLDLTAADIFDVYINGQSSSFDGPQTWLATEPSNPGLPGDIYGIKFDDLTETMTLRINFNSYRVPVWADFYAKDGNAGGQGTNAAWNAGLLVADPTVAAGNGTINNHILAPDTEIVQPPPGPTPELPPGALLLLTLIPAAWAGVRAKKK